MSQMMNGINFESISILIVFKSHSNSFMKNKLVTIILLRSKFLSTKQFEIKSGC